MSGVFIVLGGLGLLLFGMKMMSTGLEVLAGDSLQVILKKATANRFFAVFAGIIATIAINSSTAVTIITVGFVNSRLITLTQAIGIIMGANVGTTFSAQLIAFRIDTIAPVFIFIGIVLHLFFKKRSIKNVGYIILGFGVLFFSITVMGGPLRELAELPSFKTMLVAFDSPILALLAGFLFTAIVQSSSAAMGILVTMHLSGVPIPFETSAFIILGTNIGTSTTTVIASLPASRESKRAALFHISYDIIGSITFGTLIILFPGILAWFQSTWTEPARQVAMFHTLYNVATMCLLISFIKPIALTLQKIVPLVDAETIKTYEKKLMFLEPANLKTPRLAVINAHLEICRMFNIAGETIQLAVESFFESNTEKAKKALGNEKILNFLHRGISEKLIIINNMSLYKANAEKVSKMFNIISDVERIGDHAENIAEHTVTFAENGLELSEVAIDELKELSDSVFDLISNSIILYEKEDGSIIPLVESTEKRVDKLAVTATNNHIERLKSDACDPQVGVIFTDIITDLERSADHAYNIAYSIQVKPEEMEFIEIG